MWFLKVILLLSLSSLSTNAIVINCQFVYNYQCTIVSGGITSQSDVTVTAITGTYPAGVTSSSITVIDGRGVLFRYFPRGLTKFFPNIDVIFFENGLREIHKEDLQQFSTKLKSVYLSTNVLEVLEKDLFVYNPNIERLYIERNAIKYVDPNIFVGLTKLTNLGFLYNNCASGKVENNASGAAVFAGQIIANCSVVMDENTRTILELQGLIDGLNRKNTNLTNYCGGSGSGGTITRIF